MWVEIEPLLFGEARMILTDGTNVFRQWWYRSVKLAEENLLPVAHVVAGFEPVGHFRRLVDPRDIVVPESKALGE